ncbi:hypothetical protein [Haladaptatus sp. T7]|uniref:hypothetical protein n=1 Tax=Haladaptatus sp. T7 TaxID=2029368 RepID=UPI0021A2565F|nr:hypothetical protein [Haladaptatus sp. T7]GKZ14757.1 hypothetical protein HAL_26380 [Haladaptatus sp. T7]
MDDEDGSSLSPEEFVEYCETQAGLLSGRVETMASEADELLDDIDAEIAEIRTRLDDSGTEGDDIDAAAVAELETDLDETRAVVEAKRARMVAFRELADGYVSLAEDLRSDVDDGREAMERVVRFEADADAPVYFDDRKTVYEAATEGNLDAE